MPKKQLELPPTILMKEQTSMMKGTGVNILSLAFPKEQEKLNQFYDKFNILYSGFDGSLDDLNEKERLNEGNGLSANDDLIYTYSTKLTRASTYASPEAYRILNDKAKEYYDYTL